MANNLGVITLNGILIIKCDTDPSVSAGLVAPIGSYASATDGSGLYYKSASGDTSWINLNVILAASTAELSLTEVASVVTPTNAMKLWVNTINQLKWTKENGQSGGFSIVVAKDNADSGALTGTTNNTLMKSLLVLGNTFVATDIPELQSRSGKTGTAGGISMRFYVNTSSSLSGATLIGTQTMANSATFSGFQRNLDIKSASNTEVLESSTSVSGDIAAASAAGAGGITSVNIDWTTDKYLILAAQLVNGADSVISKYMVLVKK